MDDCLYFLTLYKNEAKISEHLRWCHHLEPESGLTGNQVAESRFAHIHPSYSSQLSIMTLRVKSRLKIFWLYFLKGTVLMLFIFMDSQRLGLARVDGREQSACKTHNTLLFTSLHLSEKILFRLNIYIHDIC